MHRLLTLTLVGLVTLVLPGGGPRAGFPAYAQMAMPRAASPGETPPAPATPPVVGAWRWDRDLAHPNTRLAYGVFHADGTYEEVSTGFGTAVGVWQATGARSISATYVFQDLASDPAVVEPGVITIRLQADVTPSGNVLAARFTYDARTLDGVLVEHGGPDAAQGARVTMAPQGPLGAAAGLWSLAAPGQPGGARAPAYPAPSSRVTTLTPGVGEQHDTRLAG